MLPVASCCQKEEIPARFIILLIIAKMITPTTVPPTPPIPPSMLFPPNTTAEMHGIKKEYPISALAVATLDTCIFPAIQHNTEQIIYAANNTLSVWTPE